MTVVTQKSRSEATQDDICADTWTGQLVSSCRRRVLTNRDKKDSGVYRHSRQTRHNRTASEKKLTANEYVCYKGKQHEH